VQAAIAVKIGLPFPEATSFRYKIKCGPGSTSPQGFCAPPNEETSPFQSSNGYTLQTMINPPGSLRLDAEFDEVRTGFPGEPDCTWVARWSASKFDYYTSP
jgi:hypothetical protein